MALSAAERAKRLLAIVPWVAARGGASIEDICERFDVPRERLLADLELLWFVGTPPYSPADLIEVDLHDDQVTINYADAFSRPLRLTPEQGLAMLAAGQSLGALPGSDSQGPLARALEKLSVALGVQGRVEVHLGAVPAELLAILRTCIAEGTVVEIDHYSHNRDARALRSVEPQHLFVDRGAWYLTAYCQLAGAQRTFRVDRIHSARPTGKSAPVRSAVDAQPETAFAVGPNDGETVVLEVTAHGAWVVDDLPCEVLERREDRTVVVELVVTGQAWLERLLLRLGPEATVVEGPKALAAAAASRVLAVYGEVAVADATP